MSDESSLDKWEQSAQSWINVQGEHGDWSRREILDPALARILTDLSGKTVLDVGCGEGRYARVMRDRGAIVTGIDPVPKFIERAQQLDPQSVYLEASAEAIPIHDRQFDLILCYLSLVDIPNLKQASLEMVRLLKIKGELVLVNISNMASTTETWVKDENGKKLFRKVDRYMEHFEIDLAWKGISITNYHRPLSDVLGDFHSQGCVTTKFVEPLPDISHANYEEEFRCPTFQIIVLRKDVDFIAT